MLTETCRLDFDRITKVRETDDPDTALAEGWCDVHRHYCRALVDADVLASYGHLAGEDRGEMELIETE